MSKDPTSSWQQSISALSRVVIGAVIVVALTWGRPVLMPIALAILLTFLLNPIVRRLQRFGISRLPAVILAVSLAGIGLTIVGVTGSQQVSSMLATLPENTAKIISKLKTLKAIASGPTAQRFEHMIEAISKELSPPIPQTAGPDADHPDSTTDEAPDRIVVASEPYSWTLLTGHLGSAMEVLAMLAFATVLLIFFLMDREGLRDRIVLLAGRSRLTLTSKALEDATTRVSRYIGMVAMVNGGFGILLCLGLFALGVPYAVLWGCVAAVFRFVPYLGPWIGAVFPITMSLALSDGWGQPLAVLGFVLVLELATNNIVEPLAFGHTTGVAPTALLISAAFWLFIWGPIGLILSAPFAVSLVVLGKNIPQLRFLNILLGDQPALSDDAGYYQRLLVQDPQQAARIITNRTKGKDPDHAFDEVIIPALSYLKRDLERGHLTEEEGDSVLQLLRDSLPGVDFRKTSVEATEEILPAKLKEPEKRLWLLACPTNGEPDRVALQLLNHLLDDSRWNVEVATDDILTSELVARVAEQSPAAICITSIAPDRVAHARYLCKKLRTASKDVPLIVGRWGLQSRLSQTDRVRLMEAGASVITTSLLETRKWLNTRYPLLCETAPDSAVDKSAQPRELQAALAE